MNKVTESNRIYVGIFYCLNGFMAIYLLLNEQLGLYLSILQVFLLLVVIINLIFVVRTRNPWYLITAGHYSIMTAAVLAELAGLERVKQVSLWLFLFSAVSLLIVGQKKKLKWRKHEILELAARGIVEKKNGYTNRPMVCGHIDLPFSDIVLFGQFARRQLLGITRMAPDRIDIIVTEHTLPFMLGMPLHYDRHSWVSIEKSGMVSVHLTERDYARFKEKLTFDQLCQALGTLFISWIREQSQEQENRIVGQLNGIRSSAFSGGLIGY